MKLHLKLLLVLGPVLLLSAAAISYYSRRAVARVLLDDLSASASQTASLEMPGLAAGLEAPREAALLRRLQAAQGDFGALYAAALAPDGTILADTDVADAGKKAGDAFTRAALASPGASSRRLTVQGEPVLELSFPVDAGPFDPAGYLFEGRQRRGGRRLGLLRVGLPLRRLLSAQRRIVLAVVSAAGLILAGAAAMLVFFAHGVLGPLAELARAAESVGHGRYGTKVAAARRDELGELARRFNRMSEDLQRTTVSKDLLAQILERSLDGVLLVDAEGRIAAHNKRFVELFDIPRDVLEDRDDRRALDCARHKVSDPDTFLERVERLYGDRSATSQDELAFTDGRTIERYSAPIFDAAAGYSGRVWYFRDITDRKRAEEAEALRERERVQRDFLAAVSHDLRTPITAIKGFAETLLGGGLSDPENGPSFLRTIERNADRLAHLVDNLLTVSVLESGLRRLNLEPVDLEAAARDLAASLDPILQRSGLTLALDVPTGLLVRADVHQLGQVLQNLLDNAVKFSSWGSTVALEARREAGQAQVAVADRGCGIPEMDLPRVFERFQRAEGASRKIKGTGLGLSIVKQIVELHGGRVWVESRPGEGTTVRFTLPLA